MLDTPTTYPAQDGAPGEHWGTDPCSSKDSASRMNSPRNSKSSGTPHISLEPKSNLCFGAEVDMEEDDGSSHSDRVEERHSRQHESCPGSPSHQQGYKEQLKEFAERIGHKDEAMRNACDEADSNSERHSHDLHREGASPEARAVEVDIETRSGNSAHAASARASPQKESLSGRRRGKLGEGKRQKTSHWASPEEQPKLLNVEQTHLQRLENGGQHSCQLANEPNSLQRPLAVLKEALPEERLPEDDATAAVVESLSRACSTAPAMDGAEEDVEAEEPVPSKKQRSAKQKRAASASLPAKRGSRASASGHLHEGRNNGSLDEDYVPPGEAAVHDHVPVKRARVQKATRAICKSDSLPAAAPSASSRQPARLRWSASVGPASPPIATPSACRRLRSQPVDLTDLRPDAFAFCAPAKRARHAALHHGLLNLQQLCDAQPTQLVRSQASGIAKPMPQWEGKRDDEQLLEPVIASLRQSKARRDSDCKAMDGIQPPTRVDTAALAERLGQSRLGKAARVVQPTEGSKKLSADEILPGCKQLFPAFMAASLASWQSKLDSTFVSLFGEAAPCTLARQNRDAHNAWDDLLARHALESETIETFENLLQLK